MNWIVLFFALELGFAPNYGSLNITPSYEEFVLTENIGYVLFEAEVVIEEIFFIGGATKTYIQGTDEVMNFFPFENNYMFNIGIRYSSLELGYRHLCLHPSRPYEIYYQPQSSMDAYYDELYIRISKSFK